jgi:hypothetical protein
MHNIPEVSLVDGEGAPLLLLSPTSSPFVLERGEGT